MNTGESAAANGKDAPSAAAGGHEALLSALGPLELSKLLTSAADLGLQQPLVDQLARMLQVRCWCPIANGSVGLGALFLCRPCRVSFPSMCAWLKTDERVESAAVESMCLVVSSIRY